MINSLKYLKRNDLRTESQKFLSKEFLLLYSYDGKFCKNCGLIQGKPNEKLGIKKFYCDCTYNQFNNKIKKEKEKINKKIFGFIFSEELPNIPTQV